MDYLSGRSPPSFNQENKSSLHKMTEDRGTDAFELWCWGRLLRVSWTARKSNQSIWRESTLNTHWKDWCQSWSSKTLATWCEESTHWKRPWCWEILKAGGDGGDRCWEKLRAGEEGDRGWDGWMASPTQWTWVW